MVLVLITMRTDRKSLRFITKMEREMVFVKIGMKTDRRNLRGILKMENQMVLGLIGTRMEREVRCTSKMGSQMIFRVNVMKMEKTYRGNGNEQ